MKYQRCTLVQVVDGNRMLLGMKKRGFGVGKWNGFGGKVEKDEPLINAAIRELNEECGLVVSKEHMHQVGIILFDFVGEDFLIEVNVFKPETFTGDVRESEEMKPKWFAIDEIPFNEMWVDDVDWYPLMLRGDLFYSHMKFKGHDVIVSQDIRVVHSVKEMNTMLQNTLATYKL